MNIRSAALAAVLLAAAAAQARGQAVELRFKPVVGQVSHYTVVNQVWMGGDTSQAPMQTTMYQTRTVTATEGANFVVKTVTDSTVMPAGSPGAGRDMMRGMGVTQTMDARGHILKTEVTPPPGLPPFVANMMTRNNQQGSSNRGQITWPEGPVSPGYTWTDTVVQSGGGGGRGARPTTVTFISTFKFERIERQAGARVAIISVNGKGEGEVNATVSGEFAVDLDAGRPTHTVMSFSMPMGNATGVSRMTMNLQK